MLSGIGPAGASARDRHRAGRRSAGRQEPAGSSRGADHVFARQDRSAFRGEMRFDRMALSMIRAYFFGTGPATVVPGGLHAFIKTRPELAVPDIEFMFRGAPPHAASVVSAGSGSAYADGYGIRPTLLHPDSRGEMLLRSADPRDPAAHRLQFLFRAERPADACAKASSARARCAYQKPLDRLSRRRDLAGREGARPTPRSTPGSGRPRSPRIIPAAPARWGPGPTRCSIRELRVRGVERPARGRCLGHARSRLGAHQCLRADDGGEGLRHDPRQAAAAGGVRRVSAPLRHCASAFLDELFAVAIALHRRRSLAPH